MKAVIMAGGKGTRLRPLTNRLPKPMVPLVDKPCMEYSIELLKKYGITEIAVTVQYLPHLIRDYFGDGSEWGVKLHYFEETQPLGTAGSVKNAEEFLDDTFLVISGDALTDFDLEQAIRFHRERMAIGTLVLTKVEVPLEYGVVMTQEDGRVVRFLEKPSWSEVFSDTVNTGIYVLEPEVLSLFNPGQVFDFSKDLFPLLLANELPLFGMVAAGYWSDIGNLEQYRQAQWDLLEGRVVADVKGEEWSPGIRVMPGARVKEPSTLSAPAFVGAGTQIEAGAQVGPHAILGRYNRVATAANLEQTVLWNRNDIAVAARLAGSTLTNEVIVSEGACVEERTVVGEKTRIGERALLLSGVKVWPEKIVSPGAIVTESLVWESHGVHGWFGHDGVSGITNRELTPERAGRMAAAFASMLGEGSTVVVGRDGDAFADILQLSVTASMLAAGVRVMDTGVTPAPVIRYACHLHQAKGGVYIRRLDEKGERTVLQFFDQHGLPLSPGMERKVEQTLHQEEFSRPATAFGTLEQAENVQKRYRNALLEEVDGKQIRSHAFTVVLYAGDWQLYPLIQSLLEGLGCRVVTVLGTNASLERFIVDHEADLGVYIGSNGQTVRWYTETGQALTAEEQTLVETLLAIKREKIVPIAVTAPVEATEIANSAGMDVIPVPASTRARLEPQHRRSWQLYGDGCAATAVLLEHLSQRGFTLEKLVQSLPPVYMKSESIFCPAEAKGQVMRCLMEEWKDHNLELLDGIKIWEGEDWVLIRPDREQARVEVVAQGETSADVERLLDGHKKKILQYREG
ncbi:sugar phosphate nucleotidyltransferase [Desmospora activa]|uniref:Mannose-1-phosphate guanylyltransferase/phosphomannomutase n=1 Tax=Desmospora activa DSM 45169 TaxID=1121389 RepID=A0A2T4Z943_9BACL|nr:sugar phosphate nucleotidyltransferase [Desmospora activa]PTM58408.1 mannose-1-phosphate guanylyltransferase/phosphomannomutase [Desmospora activa DSM 45169]